MHAAWMNMLYTHLQYQPPGISAAAQGICHIFRLSQNVMLKMKGAKGPKFAQDTRSSGKIEWALRELHWESMGRFYRANRADEQIPVQPGLEHLRDGASTTSLSSLFSASQPFLPLS